MTRLVAIDTSTWWGGIALVETHGGPGGTRITAELGLWVEDTHTAHQLDMLGRLLAGADWGKSTIDAYAASRGPGSFTGIRVGLSTARGLALAADRPCFGITSLAAMAEAFGPAEAPRVPLLGAGRGEVFGARYDAASSPPVELVPPWLGRPELAVGDAAERLVVFGPGFDEYRDTLAASGSCWRAGRSPTSIAAGVGRLALLRLDAGARDGEGLSPLYLRPPDAELKASGS